MKKAFELFHKAKGNKIISGSFVMIIGGFLGSFTNYLYHLFMARWLGPKDYGILESTISVIYLLSIPLTTISMVITKYVSSFKGENKTKKIESFFWKINKKLLMVVPVIFLVMLLFTPLVKKFLHIDLPNLFIWIIISFCIGIFTIVAKGFLQGLSEFGKLSFSGFLDGFFRLITGLIFVLLGYHLFGAIFAFFLSAIISLLISLYFVRNLFFGDKNQLITEKKEIFRFIFPVLFTNIGITSMITMDVILVRHFFPPLDAGLYSALSTLGKIVFFASSPVLAVVFPVISETYSAKKNIAKVVKNAFIVISLILLGVIAVFGLFPKLMIMILFGDKYLKIVSYVFPFGIGMCLYTFNYAFLNIFLAIKKTLPTLFVVGASIIQILLIIIFHKSIYEVVSIFIIISALLLLVLLIYYGYVKKKITFAHSPRIQSGKDN